MAAVSTASLNNICLSLLYIYTDFYEAWFSFLSTELQLSFIRRLSLLSPSLESGDVDASHKRIAEY